MPEDILIVFCVHKLNASAVNVFAVRVGHEPARRLAFRMAISFTDGGIEPYQSGREHKCLTKSISTPSMADILVPIL